MEESGLLVVISGFSGSGKGTIMRELIKRYPEEYALSVSATTRTPRDGEVDGKDYFFKTREEFLAMQRNGELLEYAEYVGNCYGTPKAYVEEQLKTSRNVLLEIEIQGALKVKNQLPNTLLVFVTPPSARELKNRLIGRATEEKEIIESRLNMALKEADGCEVYDYLVVNDEISAAVERLHQIIMSERQNMERSHALVEQIQQDLREFLKGDLS